MACWTPCQYPNQWMITVICWALGDKFQWNTKIFIHIRKCRLPFCIGLHVLTDAYLAQRRVRASPVSVYYNASLYVVNILCEYLKKFKQYQPPRVSCISTPDSIKCSLQWRHNGCDGFLNHQPRDCLLTFSIRRRSKKTSKLRVTGLCAGYSPKTGEFPAQMTSNAEYISIRCHQVSHNCCISYIVFCLWWWTCVYLPGSKSLHGHY